jgi:integrase
MKNQMTEEAKAALKAAAAAATWKTFERYPGVRARVVGDVETFYVRGRVKGEGKAATWRMFDEVAERPGHLVRNASDASKVRAKLIDGILEPTSIRREKAEAAAKAESTRWTFDKLWDSWKEIHSAKTGLGPDDSRYRTSLKDRFGDREPSSLTKHDLELLKKELREAGKADDSVISAITLLKRIAAHGVDDHGCAGLTFSTRKLFEDLKRKNRTEQLDPEARERYLKAAREYPNRQVGDACLFVEQTGIRAGNLRDLKWSDCDLKAGFIHLEKTKSGESKDLTLSDAAIEILKRHPRTVGNPYVFTGRDNGRLSRRELREARVIADQANLPLFEGRKFRGLHGLRHALGSRLANDGTPLFVVQKVLGHSDVSTTARYSHLQNDTIKDALNRSNAKS